MRPFFLLVLLIALSGCSTYLYADPSSLPPATAVFGQPFELKLGQTAKLEDGLTVKFQDVPGDGRCSSCTASFYAAIDLEMTAPGKTPTQIVINTPPRSTVEGETAPYTFKYIDLQPQRNYPNDALNRAEYVLTLAVSKGE